MQKTALQSKRRTCPIEAAANGRSLNSPNFDRQSLPSSVLICASTCEYGMKSAPCRTRSKISSKYGGTMDSSTTKLIITGKQDHRLPCNESICPILRAAPRTRHNVLTMRSAFAGVMKELDELFDAPNARLVASAAAPEPRPTASMPKLANRLNRELGTLRARLSPNGLTVAPSFST